MPRRIDAGWCSAGAWAAYGAVETMLAIVLRRVAFPGTFVPPHWSFTLFLLFFYPAAGFAFGFVVGRREWIAIPLVIAFTANVLATQNGFARLVPVASAIIILAAVIQRWGWLTNGWSTSLLLAAPIWAGREFFYQRTLTSKAASSAGMIAAVVIGSWLLRRSMREPRVKIDLIATLLMTTFGIALGKSLPINHEPPVSPPHQRLPNLVLIILDTVRADHLTLYGYDRMTTPKLTAFARGATVFERAYAPSNMTLSTHASLFTGLYASEHGAHYDEGWSVGKPLPQSAVTLAELLSARGYRTASVAANYAYLGKDFGLDQGFQYVDALPPSMPFGGSWNFYLRFPVSNLVRRIVPLPPRTSLLARGAEEITGDAVSWLKRASTTRRPFFLFVNYMDAHAPCIAPAEYDRRFSGRDPSQPVDLADRKLMAWSEGALSLTSAEKSDLIARYDGAIAFIDDQLDMLIRALRASGAYDNTLIIIAADHGEAFGEHGLFGHGTSNYDDQTHVPLIVKMPSQVTGERITTPVSLLDVWPLLAGTSRAPHRVISESFPMRGAGLIAGRRSGTAEVRGDLKLIDDVKHGVELYDLGSDPGETKNLAPSSMADRMRNDVVSWRAKIETPTSNQQQPIDPETLQRLKSLGYLH